MQTVKIRNLEIGSGRPKICVPIVGRNIEEILASAEQICQEDAQNVDLAEWRADWFEGISDMEQAQNAAQQIRKALGELPLLFTFRTAKEGGERQIGEKAYRVLNEQMIKTGCFDLVDVELFRGEETVRMIVEAAHTNGVNVIVSNHDFAKTPPQEEMVCRLRRMQKLGADILKIAVMPQCKRDVLTLLAATEEMYTEYAGQPLVTMSMGQMGVISRVCGETFGSAMTFGTVGRASAPGQIEAGKLKKVLDICSAFC